MSLVTEFESAGSWLFRWRSYLAIAAIPIFASGFLSFSYLGNSHVLDEIWNVVCLLVSFSGLFLRVFTVGYVPRRTSGRNTKRQVATALNTTGVYSIVRHPLYLGNYLAVLGIAMFFHSWWIVALTTCGFALYYERIMFAEESFLRTRFGERFENWARVTPAIVPNLRLWKSSPLPFSWRSVLRREYTGFFVVILTFACFEIAGDSIVEGRLTIDWPWVYLTGFQFVVYLTLLCFKRHTRLLTEPGR